MSKQLLLRLRKECVAAKRLFDDGIEQVIVMQKFIGLVQRYLRDVREIMPWDLEEHLQENPDLLVLDVREP